MVNDLYNNTTACCHRKKVVKKSYYPGIFALAGIVFSSFYIFRSGLPQPSDFLFLLFSVLLVIKNKLYLDVKIKDNWFILLSFFYFLVVINGLSWSIIEENFQYNSFSLFLTFDILLFFSLREYLIGHACARGQICTSYFIALFVLTIITILGIGKSDFGSRYNAFFNDPNQMAHWVICVYAAISLLYRGKLIVRMIIFVVALYVVVKTESRSGIVGMGLVFLGVIMPFLKSRKAGNFNYVKIFSGAAFVVIMGYAVGSYFMQLDVTDRLIDRFASADFSQQAEIRGYGRIADYPQYLVLGAGKADDERFGSTYEIHSTPAAILFYYGIFGFVLFFGFLYFLVKKLSLHQAMIALGPLAYSFSTFNARTPIFWLTLAVCSYVLYEDNKKIDS